jgi:4-diphosphocytidyl-2-C-methyl-D-erythritol kinase
MFAKRISKSSIVIGAPAKVNLYLEIIGRRADGYHNINSLFQAVSLFDRLRFSVVDKEGIEIKIKGNDEIPVDKTNTIYKAYSIIQQEVKTTRGLFVEVEKNIPSGGGLGGGSADAAATINACNILFDLTLSREDMNNLGIKVGSDVPFFFSRGQAHVAGKGEILTEMTVPTDYWMILVTPKLSISTATSYASLNLALTDSKSPCKLQGSRTTEEFFDSLRLTGNDFESGHLETYPELGKIKNALLAGGAKLARMSGSGSTIFGIFDMAPECDSVHGLEQESWQVNTVRPIVLPRIEVQPLGGEPWK